MRENILLGVILSIIIFVSGCTTQTQSATTSTEWITVPFNVPQPPVISQPENQETYVNQEEQLCDEPYLKNISFVERESPTDDPNWQVYVPKAAGSVSCRKGGLVSGENINHAYCEIIIDCQQAVSNSVVTGFFKVDVESSYKFIISPVKVKGWTGGNLTEYERNLLGLDENYMYDAYNVTLEMLSCKANISNFNSMSECLIG